MLALCTGIDHRSSPWECRRAHLAWCSRARSYHALRQIRPSLRWSRPPRPIGVPTSSPGGTQSLAFVAPAAGVVRPAGADCGTGDSAHGIRAGVCACTCAYGSACACGERGWDGPAFCAWQPARMHDIAAARRAPTLIPWQLLTGPARRAVGGAPGSGRGAQVAAGRPGVLAALGTSEAAIAGGAHCPPGGSRACSLLSGAWALAGLQVLDSQSRRTVLMSGPRNQSSAPSSGNTRTEQATPSALPGHGSTGLVYREFGGLSACHAPPEHAEGPVPLELPVKPAGGGDRGKEAEDQTSALC